MRDEGEVKYETCALRSWQESTDRNKLNDKLITATNTKKTLRGKLTEVIIREYLGSLSSGIIPAEAVDSDQGHFLAIRYSFTSLVFIIF